MTDELNEIIVAGEQVKEVLDKQGWKKHIEPLLDKMIRDVIGGKADGRWDNGSVAEKNQTEYNVKELLAYKTALINFHNGVYQFIDDMESAREKIEELAQNRNISDYDIDTNGDLHGMR